MEFKFAKRLRNDLKTFDYFLVKFDLILRIEVKYASQKIGGEFLKNSRKIAKFGKEIGERLREFAGYLLNMGKKSVENLWNFKINFANV